MVEFLEQNKGGNLAAWTRTSVWSRDTGGERDRSGAPKRAQVPAHIATPFIYFCQANFIGQHSPVLHLFFSIKFLIDGQGGNWKTLFVQVRLKTTFFAQKIQTFY